MLSPKVSIIVPVFNAKDKICRCVDSIIAQKEENWELILIDDGSQDDSGKICDSYSLSDNRITVIHKENGGVSSARNAGIEIAMGEYISFIDADDYIDENYLGNMLEYAPTDLIICGFFNPGGVDFSPNKYIGNIQTNPSLVKDLIDIPFYLDSPWCKLFRLDIIKYNNFRFDENLKLSEDTLFSYQYLKECDTITILPNKLYTYDGLWGGGAKYSLSVDELIDASKKNISAIKAIAHKFDIEISTRYKCFHYSKLNNVIRNFSDRDIYQMYIQSHDYISIEDFLGDERLSPLTLATINLMKVSKNGTFSDCKNSINDINRFITVPIGKIKFSNRKYSYLMKSIYFLGATITSILLTLITKH